MALLRSPIIFITLIALMLILPGIANRDFSTRGEPREALIAQSMVHGGEWVLGRGYGDVVPSKPPLTHWIAAVSAKVSGAMGPLNARIPSALCSVLAVVLLYVFVANRFGVERGFLSAIILLTSIEWFRTSITARVDMTLSAALLAGFLAMFHWLEQGTKRIPWLAIAGFTLATLTKGPVSIVLPGIVLVVFLATQGEPYMRIARAALTLFLPTLLLGGLWYLAAYLERREAFIDKVWYENVQRFLGTQEDEPHKGSVLALWLSMAVGLLPWSLFLAAPLYSALGALRSLRSVTLLPKRVWGRFRNWFIAADRFEQFGFIVLLSVLVFFAIPGSKRSVYLLPAYPFAALFISGVIIRLQSAALGQIKWVPRACGSVTLLLAALLSLALIFQGSVLALAREPELHAALSYYLAAVERFLADSGAGTWAVLAALLLVSLANALPTLSFRYLSLRVAYSVALWWGLTLFVGNSLLFPALVNGLSAKPFAQELATVLPGGERLFSYGTEFYGLSFYLERAIYRYEDSKPNAGLVVLNEADFNEFHQVVPTAQVMMRSSAPITKPDQHVLLVQIK